VVRWQLAGLALLLAACGGSSETASCPTTQLYDPATAEYVELWPDASLTAADVERPAGLHLDISADRANWVGMVGTLLAPSLKQATAAGGFARGGGVLFRFSAPIDGLPRTAAESVTSESVIVANIATDPPTRIPVEVELAHDGTSVLLQPVEVLAPAAQHVAVVTNRVTSEAGCVAPSPHMRTLLNEDQTLAGAIAQLALAPNDVVAATAFTTHGDHAAVVAAANHVDTQSFSWSDKPSCVDQAGLRRCQASFNANDYRQQNVVQSMPTQQYTLPVTITLPSSSAPGAGTPRPLIMFGHGMSGTRASLNGLDAIAEELGVIIVATDALRHGDHPTKAESPALAMLGINVSEDAALDTLVLKSNFNQTSLDRLQLLSLLKSNPDIDGDGKPDIDTSRMGYWGISLGALLAPGLLALATEIDLAILSVGGGKLTQFVQDSSQVQSLLGALAALLGGPDEFRTLMLVAQSLVDAGDPMQWGAHVLRDRFRGSTPPHLLLPLANADEVVPLSTGIALARALKIPQVEPVALPIEPLSSLAAPVEGNLAGRTVGYFQFDRVGNPPAVADHGLPTSKEAMLQARHFLQTWLEGTPQIIDPYPAIGTPPL